MAKIYSYTIPFELDALDAYCALAPQFSDRFVYYDKAVGHGRGHRRLGLGRCIALSSLREAESVYEGPVALAPVFFSFNRFDEGNPAPSDPLSAAFPRLLFMLPELVLISEEGRCFLQVNSLGPIRDERARRFADRATQGGHQEVRRIAHRVCPSPYPQWERSMEAVQEAIAAGRVSKLVLSRRDRLEAEEPFTSTQLLVNLIEGPALGVVFLYNYGDLFFCGCSPELLVRKEGIRIEALSLAGSCDSSRDPMQRTALAQALFNDPKNRAEHAYVVDHIRQVLARRCYDLSAYADPEVRDFGQIQHLYSPVTASLMEGTSLSSLVSQLAPTPALAGSPVGEALMLLRRVEPYNRGFFGGAVGFVDAEDDGEFSIAIRCGVFDGRDGWLYAGCGIVEGSDSRSEYDEVSLKMSVMGSAFGPR